MATNPITPSEPVAQPDAHAMPMADLKAAMIAAEQQPVEPVAAPVAAEPVVAAPVAPTTDGYTLQTTPEGVVITLENGNVFKGKDINEVLPTILAAKVQSERYIKELKGKVPEPAPVVQPPVTPAQMTEEQYSQEYFNILTTKGPDAAFQFQMQAKPNMLLDAMAPALGLKSGAEVLQQLRSLTQTSEVVNDNMVAAQFHQFCPDFPATEVAADALTKHAVEMGLNPRNPEHLRASHADALRLGLYKPITAGAAPERPTPNPPPPGGSAPVTTGAVDPHRIPLADLKAMINNSR